MKVRFKLCIFLILVFSFKAYAETSWVNEVFMRQNGSCVDKNLSFSALRFTKIPLKSDSDNNNLFLRIILFIRPDNTVAIRFTTQELLGCQVDSSGNEICSYRPHENFWRGSAWIDFENQLKIDVLGILSKTDELYSIQLPEVFPFSELAGKTLIGKMVLVNFDDRGVNTANLCSH